jgi:hypothetical protein
MGGSTTRDKFWRIGGSKVEGRNPQMVNFLFVVRNLKIDNNKKTKVHV